MSETTSTKNPWFGPKIYGFGISPRTWQGWLSVIIFILIETLIVPITQHVRPSWFIAKVHGYGWDPNTWQGWSIILFPGVLFILFVVYMYFKQQKT